MGTVSNQEAYPWLLGGGFENVLSVNFLLCEIFRGAVLLENITLVRHKKARFDSTMHGSTQKCPPQHTSVDIAIIIHPTLVSNIFSDFIQIIRFLRTHREMKIK